MLSRVVISATAKAKNKMKKNYLELSKVFCLSIAFSIGIWGCQTQTTEHGEESEELATASEEDEEIPSPPRTAEGDIGAAHIQIAYASPGVKGREVYGDLVPYGKVWRTGANAATIMEISEDIQIQGQSLPKGKYALFSIPTESGPWTFIFNKTWDQWGAYDYDEAEDALRVETDPIPMEESVERLRFEVDGDAGKIVFAWADVMLALDIE